MCNRIYPLGALLAVAIILGSLESSSTAPDPADTHPGLNLIPWPRTVTLAQGRLKLTNETRIVAAQKDLTPLGEILSGEIALLTGLKLKVTTGADQAGDIVLAVDKTIQADEPILAVQKRELVKTRDGAHHITISDRAVVRGFDYRAVAEGSATLLQAIGQSAGEVSLPKLTIHDWPHADYCGQLVDVARQNHPVAWLKKMVQVCRFYKVRYLHLHLTDDQGWTIPSTKYPQLGSKNHGTHGGPAPKVYTLDELKELVGYADARGVTLVPEFEMPGHSAAALRSLPEIFDAINPESKQPVGMGCMNMASEEIYPALDTIIGEMCDVFKSSPYFHIGGDEVSMGRVSLHPGYKAFMAKHQLKNDHDLANYFIVRINDIVKKHGKKTIKWEGLANQASRDIIVMTWDKNNNTASQLIAQGFTTITCPWDLGVPWEEWNMYICNGSKLKKGDSVLGSTLVAWEQSPQTHLAGVRSVASRQERTWNPDHAVTAAGFAARFQALDAAVGKLLQIPVTPKIEATFTASAGTSDLLEPAFAFDGNDATFYKSARALKEGDHFTVMVKEPLLIHAMEVLTGINNKGLIEGGAVQVSADGEKFKTVATLKKGSAQVVLTENKVQAIRLLATSQQTDPLVVREIKLQLMVQVAGMIKDPAKVVGAGNVAVLKDDATFTAPMNNCNVPAINKDFTLTLKGGGSPCNYTGPIGGKGKVEIDMGGANGKAKDAALTLSGKAPNTMEGTWLVKSGRVVLAKEPGVSALGGTIIVGGTSDQAGLVWNNDRQLSAATDIRLLTSPKGGAHLNLNGFHDTLASLTMEAQTRILTQGPAGGGVLKVGKLVVDGKAIAKGVYTASSPWVQGSGYVVVGAVETVTVSGSVDPNEVVGTDNLAVLKAASTFKLSAGENTIPVDLKGFPLTLKADGLAVHYSGFITGKGSLHIEPAAADQADRQPLEITGVSANTFKGPTVLVRGVLKLNKSGGALAIPGDLTLGGSAPDNNGDGVIWAADGQVSPSAVVTLTGTQPSFLDLAGHKVSLAKVIVSKAGVIRTGKGGALTVKQLHVHGKRLPDGTYKTPQPWLNGSGIVSVDARVDIKGICGDCYAQIGAGNIANLTGHTSFNYPISECDLDIITNGHTITFDSGNGNAFCYRGTISGTGDVVFLMGPSHTDYKDAPLRLAGPRPNTATGKFYVRKGRVQLEKPDGVDAISGDVVVGGQGFNDCLFWVNSNQIKDSAHITLIGAGNNGFAYLHLNGCQETVAGLTMMAGNMVKTDSAKGVSGMLTVRSLTIDGVKMPAGTYTAANTKWIEGKGKVVVQP